ncbi:peptidase domain-containing ABC transporter [Alistipes ihumii]|jgi:ATP-binding cassette subfamily B protein|uniref:peptidase domain-containing ABC transporter n=1 Tax=Alistipes ihumii TaxID=1470347 RepID=UPI0024944213|nr:peptidase domain-containing ABC transporter [Alistipes ihumii]
MKFPFVKQLDAMDCGPACLKMIAQFYGKKISIEEIRNACFIKKTGVNLLGISEAALEFGLRATGIKVTFEKLAESFFSPSILHWDQNHFVVLYNIRKRKPFYSRKTKYSMYIADPAYGPISYGEEEFRKHWISTLEAGKDKGILMAIEPTPAFYDQKPRTGTKRSMGYLLKYLRPHKRMFYQLLLGLFAGSVLQLALPFLTQGIVDSGIGYKDINFIQLILIAQVTLIFSRSFLDIIRRWILLQIGTRVNISLVTDFIIKLVRLPMGFFDSKLTGDLIRRMEDHKKIELFLTTWVLNIVFFMLTISVFSIVLAIYSIKIFLIFWGGSILYFVWIKLFLKKRADLDRMNFSQASRNQSFLIEFIQGMPEVKLTGCEHQKRWKWESLQAEQFRISLKSLYLNQWQQTGGTFINEIKNVCITIVAATTVISGGITLGMMLSIQFIIGQMQGPIEQIVLFVQATQDAKLSLERLNEVHLKTDEEHVTSDRMTEVPTCGDIVFHDVTFSYDSPRAKALINKLSLCIPAGKTTAIVGMSGSGKTTLIKLMLRFYPLHSGRITVGGIPLDDIRYKDWRQQCGVVMQDGYIFSDTIAANIAPYEEVIDTEKLRYAVRIANLESYIESLPLKYNTRIGSSGKGLSQGQKQRLLIARAVYRDPRYIFLDEATNALDSTNEKNIMENLNGFFRGRTVVIVAHRLSTVKNADQIVVLKNGEIIEIGSHTELVAKKGDYHNLVKDQLAIGA